MKTWVGSWALFLDDERFPPVNFAQAYEEYRTARSVREATEMMELRGCPGFISFDHDLGEDQRTGLDLVKWMIHQDLEEDGKFIPRGFEFYVHSQNPIGKENIEKLLEHYLRQR